MSEELVETRQEIELKAQAQIVVSNYKNVTTMSEAIPALVEYFKGDKQALSYLLKAHRDAMAKLKLLDSAIETALLDCNIAYGGEYIDRNIGTAIVSRAGAKTRYDNDLLISNVAAILADRTKQANEDGEVPTPAEAINTAVETTADLVGARAPSFTGWRTGEAEKLGLKLDNYREKEGGRLKVRFEG